MVLSDTPKRLCDTTDTGKYDLLYDVIICKYKESSLKLVRGSLEVDHDLMTCLIITSMILSEGHSFLCRDKLRVKRILTHECRCNEKLKGKVEVCTRLGYTWL